CARVRSVRRLACSVAPTAEDLHGVGDHLDGRTLRALLRFPLAPLEPAVDADGAPLGEVLRAVLTLVAPDGDVEVVRLLGPLAGRRVLPPRVDREPQAADGHPARRVPELRVPREVPHEDDAVDAGHDLLLLVLSLLRTLVRTDVRGSVLGLPAGALDRLRAGASGAVSAPDAERGQVPHDAVGDLEDPRQLVERRGLGVDLQQLVAAARLLADRIAEPPPSPRVVPAPRPAALLDQLANARDDLVLPRLGQIRIEHEQVFVLVLQPIPPSVWTAPP